MDVPLQQAMFLAVGIGLFAAAYLLVVACDRLMPRGRRDESRGGGQ